MRWRRGEGRAGDKESFPSLIGFNLDKNLALFSLQIGSGVGDRRRIDT